MADPTIDFQELTPITILPPDCRTTKTCRYGTTAIVFSTLQQEKQKGRKVFYIE
jgi:hypothetical protein